MPKLFSSEKIVKVLEEHGFVFVSQKGSHAKYKRPASGLTVIVPIGRREIPIGTFKSIIRQSNLSRVDFE